MDYYLAIDIGASSGRHILGWTEDGGVKYQEIHRFGNAVREQNNSLCWDLDYLFAEIKNGLKKCAAAGKIPKSAAIDTWGVDFVLLDVNDSVIGDTVSYRDGRTAGIPEQVPIPERELYEKTGIQKQRFNTIFQLYAMKKNNPHELERAEHFLMIPDYFNYLLTGIKANEYTNATTTGLMNCIERQWDLTIIQALGFNPAMFKKPSAAGTILGRLKPEIQKEIGFDTDIILAPSHDTASAVLAVPYADKAIYISSGTWSLMGAELDSPVLTEKSRLSNFTNEGGYGGKYRYLKNIMGLWMLQCVRNEYAKKGQNYTFAELSAEAEKNENFTSYVDVTDERFLAPPDMAEEICAFCRESYQETPQTIGEICAVIYSSLALAYAKAAAQTEELTGREFDMINIVGGGSKDNYLCRLTAKKSGKQVAAGPDEATALGNILSQMIASGEATDITSARRLVKNLVI